MLTHPSAARSVSTRADRKSQHQAVLRSVRGGVSALADDLRTLDARFTGMIQGLPTQAANFDALAELADGLRCVQNDLMTDVIDTLETLSALDDTELRRRFEQRQGWRVTEGE